jgi:hypothetical protein
VAKRIKEQKPIASQGQDLSPLSLGENDQVLGVAQDRGADEPRFNSWHNERPRHKLRTNETETEHSGDVLLQLKPDPASPCAHESDREKNGEL